MIRSNIISLHIHKTAGSTFHQILARQVRPGQIVFANLEGVDQALNRLIRMNEDELAKIKIVHGHFPFGWHKKLKNDYQYITFVRDPIKRLISDYNYNKTNPSGHHHLYAKGRTLREYLSDPAVKLNDNGMTRFIAGDFETAHGNVNESTFEKAMENIEKHFAFVGITEQFDDSLLLLKHSLGFKRLFYKKENVTSRVATNLTQDENELLNTLTYYDRKLYTQLLGAFDSQLKKLPMQRVQKSVLKIQIDLYDMYLKFRYG